MKKLYCGIVFLSLFSFLGCNDSENPPVDPPEDDIYVECEIYGFSDHNIDQDQNEESLILDFAILYENSILDAVYASVYIVPTDTISDDNIDGIVYSGEGYYIDELGSNYYDIEGATVSFNYNWATNHLISKVQYLYHMKEEEMDLDDKYDDGVYVLIIGVTKKPDSKNQIINYTDYQIVEIPLS